ncbi:MAG: hypothetical protein SAL07_01815 [Oscillatoria sp. PMC 1051.18]|uniref:hypothetical protein n=1 Tax=Oscillatoria salina TaxID=331517 RepID=UPI0013B765A2|nr:hypothetical protein [Oscillatoria salina]MBZ8179907.1 hypothetical protein [Oscillatoria salina IIICB1]MEC4891995.1 hypothetical protein [Oscillatoria sp. PMC 1050.18]MEC5028621.1 hypothetical protein [Oscillatoria sp. PMC 1051.18]NET87454.1 hypothetical protein [Kamptonema sp. SIO1D9]
MKFFKRLPKIFAPLLLAALLLFTACASEPPSRFDRAQQESTQRGASSVSQESVAGGQFNKFFPKAAGGYDLVYTQEKKGFAEAKLKRDGQEVAVLSISDTVNNPSATNKFENSNQTIAGYPAASQGSTGTAILVSNRYQVKVQSRDPAFSASDRLDWLTKFDLSSLARLQ